MGRMVLNIMLTFAQFERELTAERIYDKFVASKRKCLWMHGVPPLGYDIKEQRLSINAEEATIVRWVFQRFAKDGSLQKVAERTRLQNYRNMDWTSAEDQHTPGKVLDKGRFTSPSTIGPPSGSRGPRPQTCAQGAVIYGER